MSKVDLLNSDQKKVQTTKNDTESHHKTGGFDEIEHRAYMDALEKGRSNTNPKDQVRILI